MNTSGVKILCNGEIPTAGPAALSGSPGRRIQNGAHIFKWERSQQQGSASPALSSLKEGWYFLLKRATC